MSTRHEYDRDTHAVVLELCREEQMSYWIATIYVDGIAVADGYGKSQTEAENAATANWKRELY